MKIQLPLRVYILNLPKRVERRRSICKQFEGREEFSIEFVTPVTHPRPTTSLWKSFIRIVQTENERETPFFIFCEDDHIFTEAYNTDSFIQCILEAEKYEADILSGGMSAIESPIQISNTIFWVNRFTGMQFTVIFNRFYNSILDSDLEEVEHVTDLYLSALSDKKFVIYPYISIQQEFGYSDVSICNQEKGHVQKLFTISQERLKILNKVRHFYTNIQ